MEMLRRSIILSASQRVNENPIIVLVKFQCITVQGMLDQDKQE